MKKSNTQTANNKGLNPYTTIGIIFVIGLLVYNFVLGYSGNFTSPNPEALKKSFMFLVDAETANQAHPKGFMGIIHKGGIIVPFLITMFLIVIVFSIERYFVINKAEGKDKVSDFVKGVRTKVLSKDVDGAIKLCDEQKGSIGNVVKESLETFKNLQSNNEMNEEQKINFLEQSMAETTMLEMPMLERNMSILSTIASVGTLVALMGTVLGMIKSFMALGSAGGAVDSAALSVGISEALVNTGLGILTSAIAIIAYNYFTSRIDSLTFKIDEIGMAIKQAFISKG